MTICPFKVPLLQSTNLRQQIAWNCWNQGLILDAEVYNYRAAIAPGRLYGFGFGQRLSQLVLSQLVRFGLIGAIGLAIGGCLVLGWAMPTWASSTLAPVNAGVNTKYEQRPIHNPDGIGKIYLNREIAQVMGHQGAGWLERPSREQQEAPQKLMAAISLKPTDVVADIGAGTGYFSFRIAPLVPQGKVLALDVQPEMIDILKFLKQEHQADNVQPVLSQADNPHLLPASVDLALMVDAYHEFEYPREMMAGIVAALKPGGRVAVVEYRGEDPRVLIKPLHKMTQRQVRQEMSAVGLKWLATKNDLPQQHILLFGRE